MAKKFSQLRSGMSADAQAEASAKTQKMLEEWPDNIEAMTGSWPDFPEAEALRKGMGVDVERESLCDSNQHDDPAFGLWPAQKSEDGLEYQEKLRNEWDQRPSHSELRAAQTRSKVDSTELIRADRDER